MIIICVQPECNGIAVEVTYLNAQSLSLFVAHVGEGRVVYRVLMGETCGKETTGKTQA